ncbi:hypothetical protein RIF29_37794 [Crotalaria pallida]|uniref:Uncharacterized protein n=1 Tax=Crotalaria pallida TaxID=3830 RepID=A0AAN9DZZ3_CROPI
MARTKHKGKIPTSTVALAHARKQPQTTSLRRFEGGETCNVIVPTSITITNTSLCSIEGDTTLSSIIIYTVTITITTITISSTTRGCSNSQTPPIAPVPAPLSPLPYEAATHSQATADAPAQVPKVDSFSETSEDEHHYKEDDSTSSGEEH